MAKPIATRARDIAGNLEKAKQMILEAYHTKGTKVVVIPDVIGVDLGDALRRVDQASIDLLLSEIAKFSAGKVTVVVGHPRYDSETKDRSYSYYQSVSVIDGGKVVATYDASEIDNNHGKPGPSYDTRTFQPHVGREYPVQVGDQLYYVSVGLSDIPQSIKDDPRVKVIQVGALDAADQLDVASKIGDKLACSANAEGSSSGLRCYNGRAIYDSDAAAIEGCRRYDATPEAMLLDDARWLDDYLPPAKITISLDSPEALYSLAVRKAAIERNFGKAELEENFHKLIDVVTPYYKKDQAAVADLWRAAEEILGFKLKEGDKKNPRNKYPIDSLESQFVKNTLIGDLNLGAFADMEENDSWITFDAKINAFFRKKGAITKAELAEFRGLLLSSKAFEASLRETCTRAHNGKVQSEAYFQAYRETEVGLLVGQDSRLCRPSRD